MNVHRVASHAAAWCGVVALVGCAKADNKADSAAAVSAASTPATTTTAAATMPAPIALADVAGTWKVRAVPTSGSDTAATETTLTATSTTEGWSTKFANGLVVPQKVTVAGDSIVTESAAPYKSVRRKGVTVTTRGVYRKEGDKLVGTVTAHYTVKGPDSVMVLRSEATKQP
ncbi:MAG: hypothetical protein HOQ30_20365 [Gemmatimonadaceae bacterium]|nr:hypothetical protein [Gemmatimonadaceae bacterium]